MALPDQNGDPPRRERDPLRPQTWLLAILVALASIWALRETFMFTMPLAWGLLVALAVWPVSSAIRHRVPPWLGWLGPTAGLLIVLALIAIFVIGLGFAARQIVQLAAEVVPQVDERLRQSGLGMLVQGDALKSLIDFASRNATSALNSAVSVVAGLVLILFLVLLMLTETRNWREKTESIVGQDGGSRYGGIARTVGSKFRTYFLTRLMLGAITASLYVGWLAIFGVEYLLLWGILAVLLNFIPTVGSIIAGTLPVVFVLVQRDLGAAAVIAAGLLVIEQFMGNFIDPKMMGRQLSLSPLVVLVSLLFWTWVWGLPGAFLAVPLTVLLTIVFANIDALKPIALLLTNERDLSDLDKYRESD